MTLIFYFHILWYFNNIANNFEVASIEINIIFIFILFFHFIFQKFYFSMSFGEII